VGLDPPVAITELEVAPPPPAVQPNMARVIATVATRFVLLNLAII
jgi:hypothetical protein